MLCEIVFLLHFYISHAHANQTHSNVTPSQSHHGGTGGPSTTNGRASSTNGGSGKPFNFLHELKAVRSEVDDESVDVDALLRCMRREWTLIDPDWEGVVRNQDVPSVVCNALKNSFSEHDIVSNLVNEYLEGAQSISFRKYRQLRVGLEEEVRREKARRSEPDSDDDVHDYGESNQSSSSNDKNGNEAGVGVIASIQGPQFDLEAAIQDLKRRHIKASTGSVDDVLRDVRAFYPLLDPRGIGYFTRKKLAVVLSESGVKDASAVDINVYEVFREAEDPQKMRFEEYAIFVASEHGVAFSPPQSGGADELPTQSADEANGGSEEKLGHEMYPQSSITAAAVVVPEPEPFSLERSMESITTQLGKYGGGDDDDFTREGLLMQISNTYSLLDPSMKGYVTREEVYGFVSDLHGTSGRDSNADGDPSGASALEGHVKVIMQGTTGSPDGTSFTFWEYANFMASSIPELDGMELIAL